MSKPNRESFETKCLLFCFVLLCVQTMSADVPNLINYQGRIAVDGSSFTGLGSFKLALIKGDGSAVYWMNAPDADEDGEPDVGTQIDVEGGLYSILVGDTTLPNMSALPDNVFDSSDVYLRVWFDDGVNGFELLQPDQQIVSVGYAMMAGDVPDGSISTAKLNASLNSTITSLTDQINQLTTRVQQVEGATPPASGLTVVSADSNDSALTQGGYQMFYSVPSPGWTNGSSASAPTGRTGHTAVWSSDEVIVWGGYIGSNTYSNSGGRYDPDLDTWTTVATFGAPTARQSHSSVWTGSEMIVWGGFGSSGYLNSGGRYAPTAQNWSSVTTTGSPSARGDHACVWTGSTMIVWGGRSSSGFLADGAHYNPTGNQWTSFNLAGAPSARHSASVVWTGDRMLVWGGDVSGGVTNSGGNLSVNGSGVPQSWSAISTTGAPSARTGHSAVWTGSKMIVWGGRNGSTYYGDGAIYDPVANTWTALPGSGSPTARSGHSALWSGSEMLVFFGENGAGALSSGAAYDPVKNTWRSLSSSGGPVARSLAQAVWTGSELIVFGGSVGQQLLGNTQRLDPRPTWYFYRKL